MLSMSEIASVTWVMAALGFMPKKWMVVPPAAGRRATIWSVLMAMVSPPGSVRFSHILGSSFDEVADVFGGLVVAAAGIVYTTGAAVMVEAQPSQIRG